ncbi:MAG: hypothetical protein MPN21_21125 [Thermoanaerobaculia bacterium]|nr:hypothetical protein [Thermoanaerobaculia bacterium]
MMSPHFLVALTLLVLPIPLSFIIPVHPEARPDPWRVARLRRALAGFGLMVAVSYSALIAFDMQILGKTTPAPALLFGIHIWSVMAWFFLVSLLYQLRKPARAPFPGSDVCSASLVPRDRDKPVPTLAWWILGGIWGLAVLLFAWRVDAVPASSLVVLASSAFLLVVGPWIDRSQLLAGAEPRLADAPDDVAERLEIEYSATRARRSWSLFALFGFSIAYKTWLAFVLAGSAAEIYSLPLLRAALGVLLVFLVAQVVLELYSHQRVSALRRECVEG